MKNRGVILYFAIACFSSVGLSQVPTLGSYANVSSGTQSPICEQNIFGPSPASCSASWDFLTLGIDAGGSGSGLASTEFGSLHGTVQAATYVRQTFEGNAETTSTAAGYFYDYLTFPGLTSPARLRATMALSGKSSGDLSWIETPAKATVALESAMNEDDTSSCHLESAQGTCSSIKPVGPGDMVRLLGALDLFATAISSGTALGTDSMSANYMKPYGAEIRVALIDAEGNIIRGPAGKIKAASGTRYHEK